jgi:outer membrane protein assembly factor BamB
LKIVCRGLSIILLVLILTSVGRSAEPSSSAPLGSPNYRPTPERPFGWRGDGSGQFPGATPVIEWSAKKNVRWSTVVGNSYSSPILTEKSVFVMSEPNLLVCIARADGKEQWKIKIEPTGLADKESQKAAEKYKPPEAGAGMATATPVTDGTNVYVLLANGILCSVGLDEKPKWMTYIDARKMPGYGRSSSPILYAGKLFVHMTDLYAFDPATGKQLWVNSDAKSNYGTPLGMKIGGVDVIITSAGDVVSVDKGKSLNSAIGQAFHASPIAKGDVVYFGEGAASAVRLNAAFKDKELWNQMVPGDVFGSPLLHDGLLFTATGKGELFAFDASEKGLPDPVIAGRSLFDAGAPGGPPPGAPPGSDAGGGGSPIDYASLTLAGKYLFLNSNQGDTVVLDATRDAKQVAKNTLPDGSGATPIFSGSDMYMRDGDKLYCIGK